MKVFFELVLVCFTVVILIFALESAIACFGAWQVMTGVGVTIAYAGFSAVKRRIYIPVYLFRGGRLVFLGYLERKGLYLLDIMDLIRLHAARLGLDAEEVERAERSVPEVAYLLGAIIHSSPWDKRWVPALYLKA